MTGPVIVDLKGPEVEAEEREILQHPLVAGVILFSRHYESPRQLADLCKAIRAVRSQPLLITVDHEGGRVQRFREGFTRVPPMRELGSCYDQNPEEALKTAEACGWLVAAELGSVNINLSFAPVLDLDRVNQTAIGDRAFHSDPRIVFELAKAFIQGMRQVGMCATGKHFPGHGGVTSDTHKVMPIDQRDYQDIETLDMQPFIQLIKADLLDGIMPAHILFPKIDEKPVGFSSIWLKTLLRHKIGFQGMVISDDLNMEGASFAGDYAERAKLALTAGCNLVLICNNRPGAIQILDRLSSDQYKLEKEKIQKFAGQFLLNCDYDGLLNSREWKEKNKLVMKLNKQEETL